jgi:hyperosmotically inducible periplasmic protein
MRSSTRLALTLVSVLCISGLAVRSAHAGATDAWITTKARIALLTTDGAGRTAVKVDTEHGQVTLHGKVSSQAAKDKAEEAVRGVDGVKSVRNLLQIVPETRRDAVKASDADVKKSVEAALKTDKSLEGINVKSVDDGVVLLDGSTETLEQKLRAIETAYDCAGVWRVASEIETKDR